MRRVRYAPFFDRTLHRGVYNFAWWVPNAEQAEHDDLAILPVVGDAPEYRDAKRAARGDAAPAVGEGFTKALEAEVHRTLLDQLGPVDAERLRTRTSTRC